MADHAASNANTTTSTSTAAARENEEKKKRSGKGRKKVDIKKIDDKVSQVVTFSKRRAGLHRKTHDLCSLSGAEAAVISFSPAGKPYAFGSPSVVSVLDRYLKQTDDDPSGLRDHQDYNLGAKVWSKGKEKMEERDDDDVDDDDDDDDEGEEEEEEGGLFWEKSIEEMGLDELKQFKAALEKLRVGLFMDLKKRSCNP